MRTLWIGGSPCAGKSSVADMLADQFNFNIYRVDHQEQSFFVRSQPETQPIFRRLVQSKPDKLWLRPVAELVDDEIAYCAEPFPLLLEDVSNLTRDTIVEGAGCLPQLVIPQLSSIRDAVWMVPTEEFQRFHYAQRDWAAGVVSKTSDPPQAWENWMQRDAHFARTVASETKKYGGYLIIVDGQKSVQDITTEIATWMRLSE